MYIVQAHTTVLLQQTVVPLLRVSKKVSAKYHSLTLHNRRVFHPLHRLLHWGVSLAALPHAGTDRC